jgi:hypothetical protein
MLNDQSLSPEITSRYLGPLHWRSLSLYDSTGPRPRTFFPGGNLEEAQEVTFWRIRVGGDAALIPRGRSATVRVNIEKLCGRFITPDDERRVAAGASRLQMAVLQHCGVRVHDAADQDVISKFHNPAIACRASAGDDCIFTTFASLS